MLVLGIETSCDETAAAVVEDGRLVRSSVVRTQIDVHSAFGGVVPEVAAREHLKLVDPVVKTALQQANITPNKVDAIAVTQGPGLIGALLVGISYAKSMAWALSKPLLPVNHVFAHIHGALLGLPEDKTRGDMFPALALVVSGGHTNLYYMEHECDFQLVAYSIDDACGESFDKVAKLLNLGYPGGPEIEKIAKNGDCQGFSMPKMVADSGKLLFSYSGLKTHMVNLRRGLQEKLSDTELADLCASFQDEALGQLVRKLQLAERKYPKLKSILIAGGVAANRRFRALIDRNVSTPVYFPQLSYCSDNAAMIAALGFAQYDRSRAAAETRGYLSYNWDAFSRYDFS